MAPRFQAAQEEAAAQYGLSLAAGQALGNLDEIVLAACNGRVGTLFVALGRYQWGSYDPDSGVAKLHSELEPLDWDLLDYAAAQTLLNSGTVYAVAPGRVPGDGLAAALLRY